MNMQPLLKTSLLKHGELAKAVEKLRMETKTIDVSNGSIGTRRSLKEMKGNPRFGKEDYVKVYKGNSLRKAKILQVTTTEYYVHYQGMPNSLDEFVPHYRVIEDREMKSTTERTEIEELKDENRRLKDELFQYQKRLKHAEDNMAQEWMKECSVLQAKCLLVSDHCREAVTRVHHVLEEKQQIIDSWNCVICTTTPVNCVLVSCGHIFCMTCTNQFQSCPICRQEFILRLPFFKP